MAKKANAGALKKTREEASEIVRKNFARLRAEATVKARCKEEAMSAKERDDLFKREYKFELDKMEKAAAAAKIEEQIAELEDMLLEQEEDAAKTEAQIEALRRSLPTV